MMFEAFGFSADLRTLQKNHLSYLRARPLWWLSSFCLNSFFFVSVIPLQLLTYLSQIFSVAMGG